MRAPSPLLIAIASLTALASPAIAVEPDEILSDPALEARARDISRELRCVVCKSENIDDSNAMLARDLRILVRERLAAGDTDEEVIAFIAERYGDYVLLKPRARGAALWLWLAPALALIAAGGAGALALLRRRQDDPPPPLTGEEREALRRLTE